MKQLTEKQAIKLGESEIWKNMTDEEIVKFQLFQNRLCMPFAEFHRAIEVVLKRSVFTHEFGSDDLKKEYLKQKETPTFAEILNLIPKEKRLVINI
jgi:hypothetical protein